MIVMPWWIREIFLETRREHLSQLGNEMRLRPSAMIVWTLQCYPAPKNNWVWGFILKNTSLKTYPNTHKKLGISVIESNDLNRSSAQCCHNVKYDHSAPSRPIFSYSSPWPVETMGLVLVRTSETPQSSILRRNELPSSQVLPSRINCFATTSALLVTCYQNIESHRHHRT